MKSLVRNPYLLFWMLIPVMLLIGVVDKQILSVSIHADYYVFSKSDFCFLISILFGIIGFTYWLMKICKRKLIKWLNWMHFGLTFFGLIIILVVSYIFYYDYHTSQDLIFILSILLIIFAQLFYALNIIIGVFRKEEYKNFGI